MAAAPAGSRRSGHLQFHDTQLSACYRPKAPSSPASVVPAHAYRGCGRFHAIASKCFLHKAANRVTLRHHDTIHSAAVCYPVPVPTHLVHWHLSQIHAPDVANIPEVDPARIKLQMIRLCLISLLVVNGLLSESGNLYNRQRAQRASHDRDKSSLSDKFMPELDNFCAD